MSANIPVLLRTYQSHEAQLSCEVWEAARATSAAPIFFKHIEMGNSQPFIDGGLGCNNPSKLVLDEAKQYFPLVKLGA
jgi:patatin-like phospholipase/acyl hydrolase